MGTTKRWRPLLAAVATTIIVSAGCSTDDPTRPVVAGTAVTNPNGAIGKRLAQPTPIANDTSRSAVTPAIGEPAVESAPAPHPPITRPPHASAERSSSAQRMAPTPAPADPARTAEEDAAAQTTTTAPTGLDTVAQTELLPAIASIATASHIAESAPTRIPVYDTAWQLLVRGTPDQADAYFAALRDNGFTGAWAGVIHHAPATWNTTFPGGGVVAAMNDQGELVLSRDYILHVRSMLDAAERHGMRVGLVPAWQNLYLPGGGADAGVRTSDEVRGSITVDNARAWGRHLAEAFGGHSAVSMWVFGGDAGTNNTEANKAVWREMALGVRAAGARQSITYHTPTSEFDQHNYAGEPWLDFIAPETGHGQDAAETEQELRQAKAAYGLPVWAGEARYFNIDFDWVPEPFRRPGAAEMEADANAAAAAGVSGYVYGDAGRWTWCAGFGDATPCDADDIAASFGDGERAVIDVFRH